MSINLGDLGKIKVSKKDIKEACQIIKGLGIEKRGLEKAVRSSLESWGKK